MQVTRNSNLQIPNSLRDKLLAFRRRVWCVKMFEAFALAIIGVLIGFLMVFVLDRFVDTPRIIRGMIFAGAVVGCAMIPVALERWVLRRRRMDQLARLLSQTRPNAGDQLLGVIELSEDSSEQQRSPELVQAAIEQVAEDVASQDLSNAIPNPQHKQRGIAAGFLASAAVLLLLVTATATKNAWARFLAPWQDTPRYTYAAIEPLPETLVVPHGEPFQVSIALQETTEWHPSTAEVALPGHVANEAPINSSNQYQFELPGQIASATLGVRVGDYQGTTQIEPMLRPELKSLSAAIALPKYLGRDEKLQRDIRGAKMSVVRGSETTLVATASRDLASATINGEPQVPTADHFSTQPISIDDQAKLELEWQDHFGLGGQQPFELTIEAVDDETPSLVCENLPRRKVLLDSEVLTFQVRARDDFGVKKVGIEWQGLDETVADLAAGEKIIGAGRFDAELLELAATFCAADAKIKPQPIAVRVFVEDYLPGRERVYSTTCVFNVLNAEQHSIWISNQLTRWHRSSLDVRDRELQLYDTNQQLRDLPEEEMNLPENLDLLSQQASRERANGRRLSNLVRTGEGLLKEAMRNPEVGVGHLDKWAEMMKVLKDISENRMPTVADLLKKASQGTPAAPNKSDKKGPKAGQNRLTQSAAGDPKKTAEDDTKTNAVPTINDIESTQHEFKPDGKPKDPSESKPKQARLTLPSTKLAGNGKADGEKKPQPESEAEEAVKEQKDLLAEFDKVVDELNEVLANLEGSTLVKRLKASSRKQQQVAAKLGQMVPNSFGATQREKESDGKTFGELAELEAQNSQEASNIMDDMSAYFQRSRYELFGRVLEDMKEQDVTAGLRQLGDELQKENGLSISQAEYWSDTFDRWAEDLVEVTKCGACPGSKAKGSLPPSIVLEVLQLLEGEVKLREQTRVAEQARPAVTDTEHMQSSNQLSETQHGFQERMAKVVDRIMDLPDGEADFAKELGMLNEVAGVMQETVEILAKPETGPPAIAAETEIIELLLKSKRFNPNAGGGGGSDPGGGGGGKTETPALALVGAGMNDKEVREEMSATQATGTTGPGLPEEFRSGLDQYFNRLETWKTTEN
ncbi:MAG: hypothetical protein AB8B91_24345 [Rubripirellula sp.]